MEATTGRGDRSDTDRRQWRALTVLAAAQFMLILDITVVNVALPTIATDLQLGRAATAWVITTYTLLFGGLMLLGGRLADLLGARRVAAAGLGLFTAASLLAGVAGNAPMLLAGRAAQGIGAALLSPAALSIVTTTFTGADRNKALGIWGALGGTGAAVGVLAGGLLTGGPGWPWIFFVNVPIGLALLAVLPKVVPTTPPRGGGLDVPGAVLATTATAAGIYGLINAGDHGWAGPSTVVPLAIAVALYAAFAGWQRVATAPMITRQVIRRPVVVGALLMLVATGLLIAGFFLGSFSLQQVRGYSPMVTGLLFLPMALSTIVGARAAGHVISRLGYRPLAVGGLVVAAVGAAIPALWSSTFALVAGITIAAAGIGATFVVAATTALATVDHRHAGLASGLISTFHELGSALGISAIATVAAASLTSIGADPAGFTAGFTVIAIAAAVTALVAATLAPAGKPAAGVAGGH